jgi:hypothetical protein
LNPNYSPWLQRLKQLCYDVNWEVREQIAREIPKIIRNLGLYRGCMD